MRCDCSRSGAICQGKILVPTRNAPKLARQPDPHYRRPVQIRAFKPQDEAQVIALWRACQLVRPSNDPAKDIQRKLRVRPEWFLVGIFEGTIIASVMVGYEGHRGWLNYLAVAPEYQRRGHARALIDEAERLLRAAGCPKINLQVRNANHAAMECYRRLGFSVDEVVSMGKRLEHDD